MKSNNEEVFPCIDCITLAICKNDFNGRHKELMGDYSQPGYPIMVIFHHSLYKKCSLIDSYYKNMGYCNTRDNIQRTILNEDIK